MRNGDRRTGEWLEGVISKNEGFPPKIEYACVFMLMGMVHRGKQFHDVGDRGDNWKSSVSEKAGKSGLQETE